MKKNIIYLFLISLTLVFTSCSKEDTTVMYYQVFGNIYINSTGIYIVTDLSDTLLIDNVNDIGSGVTSGDRVIATYSKSSKTVPAGFNDIIDLVSIQKVLVKPILELTKSVSDSIGNNELFLRDIWQAHDYLTINFGFYSDGYTQHYINLGRQPGEIVSDTVELEIRHNSNNDAGSNQYFAIVSFNLNSLKKDNTDSVILHITAKEYYDRTYSKYFTYKY